VYICIPRTCLWCRTSMAHIVCKKVLHLGHWKSTSTLSRELSNLAYLQLQLCSNFDSLNFLSNNLSDSQLQAATISASCNLFHLQLRNWRSVSTPSSFQSWYMLRTSSLHLVPQLAACFNPTFPYFAVGLWLDRVNWNYASDLRFGFSRSPQRYKRLLGRFAASHPLPEVLSKRIFLARLTKDWQRGTCISTVTAKMMFPTK
jgi:hypothetical protein